MKVNTKLKLISAVVVLTVLVTTLTYSNTVLAFPGGVISGEVTCGASDVENALVSLIVDESVEDTDYTDSNGEYTLIYRDLLEETKECTIKVEKSGYTTIYRDTYLYPSDPTDFDIEWEVTQTCNGYVYDQNNLAVSGATVKLIDDTTVLDSDTTDVYGYYSFSEDVQENLYCKIQAEKTGYETHYTYIYCSEQTTSYTFRIAETSANKIALFLYATDAVVDTDIESYGNQLINDEGFDTVMYYEDLDEENDWQSAILGDLDSNETSHDFVFIHISGHGGYDEENDNSYLSTDTDQDCEMYSDDLATCINALESHNIFILITSCHAGGFVDDLKGTGVFVITESNSSSVAYAFGSVPAESVFSYYFYEKLDADYSDTEAYNSAKSLTETYYEEEIEGTQYDQDPQYILKDDQILYTWFEWW